MESQLLLQSDNYNNIVKAKRNFKKAPKERLTEAYAQVRLEALERLWTDFKSTHKSLIEQFGSQLSDQDYIKKDIPDQAEETYIEYKTELKSIINYYANKNSKAETTATDKCVESKSQIELPKIVIPKFSGKYTEWVTFRDLFISLVHTNIKLENVQKMHYLKSYVIGEAEQLLRQIPISDANYERCWSLLKSRYDNKRYISHHIIKRLLSQKNISVESASSLKELLDTTNDCLSGLSNIGIDVQNWDIIIIHILTLKLDPESRKQWEFNITNSNCSDELPTYDQIKEFLTNRYRALEFLDPKSSVNKASNNSNNQNVNGKYKSFHVSKTLCPFCSNDTHRLSACKKFAQELVDQRRDFVMSKNLCFNCLGFNHGAKVCQSNNKCKLCHRRHHTLLHPNSNSFETTGASTKQDQPRNLSLRDLESPKSGGEAEKVQTSSSVVSCFSTGKNFKQVLLATALVKAESKKGIQHFLRALLDQGSQANFVTESTVQALKLKKIALKSKISGLGGDQDLFSKFIVNLKIISRVNPQYVFTVKAHVLTSITSFLPTRKVEGIEWPELGGIELADPEYYQPNKVDLLLGADVYSRILNAGLVRSPKGSLVAQSTSLGWILSGLVDSSVTRSEGLSVLHCHVREEEDLLKRFWELESVQDLTNEQKYTLEEKLCEDIFINTTTRDKEGRYVVHLPFKKGLDFDFSDSRVIAERRLKGLENKFKKDKELKQKYIDVIKEYLQLGHAIQVPEPDLQKRNAFYLPHHAVVREDKDTTKVRVVFDASVKGKNGISLNDCLLVGPTIQPDLRHLVMRWRLSSICMSADIIKMYRQIKVGENDTDFQRFLWRETPEAVIKDYKLLRVTFGTACAPFLAVRTLKQLAEDEGIDYPVAAEKLSKEYYMDDLMCGCETVDEGIEIYTQMKALLKRGGFILQKWTSNNNTLLEKINEIEKEGEIREGINIKMDKIIKILGLTWERSEDHFRYAVKLKELELPITKRKIISEISRLFDPLGWITPCIILAKSIIQKLWISGVSWDGCVPQEILNEWYTYRSSLAELENVIVPRWVGTKSNDIRRELHGFCDASKVAYAAVIYLRVIDSKGNIHVSLVTAKSKVAPIKQISVPRLELCGAVLLKRLILETAKILNIEKNNLRAWTDSEIVLAWLNGLPNKWKVFVGNRVSEILTSLEPRQWSYVSTKQNPADCASRGVLPAELKNKMLWFQGPDFLRKVDITYVKPNNLSTHLEAVKIYHVLNGSDILDRFSTLTKLIRVVAYCRRWIKAKVVSSESKISNFLLAEELEEATETCVRICQGKHFEEEIAALKNQKEIKHNSQLKTLNPFLDSKSILRVGGRLENSDLRGTLKHPIILPKKSHLTNLIILDGHKQTLHGGLQLTLNYIRQKYWIIGANQLIKSCIHKCVICVKNKGLTCNPLMGQLPSVRATPSRPFSRSGVDFAGPIQIRTAKGRGYKSYKGYICLFICMSTRAVHVEAVSELTTEGFLQAFKRFVARRGHCHEVWSDNGTNFVGAAKEIARLFSEEKGSCLPEIADALATNGTSWHFIPPHAPHFGGLWEAGIKSIKFHLKRVIGLSTLTYEELATVLAQVEACLNSRPLSRLENNTEEPTILTPGHFLVGEPLVTPPDSNYETANISSLRRWQYTQRMLQDFWRRWSQEYLSQFFHRYKWSNRGETPRTGDVVLVKEDGLPPCRWLYGLVKCEHPGRDGITRVVTVMTKNSVIKRPVSKICVLPVTE